MVLPGDSASSTTTTGCHDIAEILLKVALRSIKSNELQILVYGRRIGNIE
jgi:hypothetical protein